MDYDEAPPMPVDRYREAQRLIPGVETLYAVLRSVLDANCSPGARVLVIGAGGGREVEALLPSPRRYRLLGIDPSADMLAIAKGFVADDTRVELRQAMLEDVAERDFDAATCCLVMHFLPDDGTKLAFLREIHHRLLPGAPLLLADAVVDDRAQFEALHGALAAHAGLQGLNPAIPAKAGEMTADMAFAQHSVISEARQRALFAEAGFRLVAPVFRGFWFGAWWLEA
jgi:tRNA (cmo5U34)-methyltransferase